MVIILYPVLIDSNCSFAFQCWNCSVFSPYFQETAIYFIAGDCLILGICRRSAPPWGFHDDGVNWKTECYSKSIRKAGWCGGKNSGQQGQEIQCGRQLGQVTYPLWVFYHLQRGRRKLIRTLIPLVSFSQLFYLFFFWGGYTLIMFVLFTSYFLWINMLSYIK